MASVRTMLASLVLAMLFPATSQAAEGPAQWRAAESLYSDGKGSVYLVPGSLAATQAVGRARLYVDLYYRLPQAVSFAADVDFDCDSNWVKLQIKDLYLDGRLTPKWPLWIAIFAPSKAVAWSGESKKVGRIRDELCARLGLSRS